ncbi:hypothetical protein JFT44_20800 [Pseudomonas sp. MF5691]|uniref:hypothetical protein n=1 Tax=Pseudomonas sp. MF5691 TaxID=2797526 RepID=UPI0018E7D538|nr:hypothetical protein [Pseudomonas sp. MF5691]MBJ2292362.1 hypothetical protein [Pseudomonas sp. MF5691]
MNKINALLFSVTFVIGQSATAAPIYLDCTIKHAGGAIEFAVKTDEDTGKITQISKLGSAFNAEGFYSSNQITYQTSDVVGGLKTTYIYTIDRSNLALTRLFRAEPTNPAYAAQIPPKTSTEHGACDIAKQAKRKI